MNSAHNCEQKLSEGISSFLEGFSKLRAETAHLSIPEQRKMSREIFAVPKDQLEPVDGVEDLVIQGKHGDIPLRIITPTTNRKRTSVLVFLHRGGWVFGSADESEGLCRRIANHTNCAVGRTIHLVTQYLTELFMMKKKNYLAKFGINF